MTYPVTGVILAGGLNTRFSGENKAFITIDGQRLIDRVQGVFNDLFEEVILVTNHPLQHLDFDGKIVTDIFPIRCSLTGIHAGLFYAAHPYAFFSACDTPFLQVPVIETVVGGIAEGVDVVIPQVEAGLEPLSAVYSKRCLQAVERQLNRGDLKIRNFFRKLRVKTISEPRLRALDPDLKSFFNINAPADLEAIRGAFGKPANED
jgi:molybdopterin-guanine dinucleotide biosynthesis protein A